MNTPLYQSVPVTFRDENEIEQLLDLIDQWIQSDTLETPVTLDDDDNERRATYRELSDDLTRGERLDDGTVRVVLGSEQHALLRTRLVDTLHDAIKSLKATAQDAQVVVDILGVMG